MLLECLREKAVDEFKEDGSWSADPVKRGERVDLSASEIHADAPRARLESQSLLGSVLGWRSLALGCQWAHFTGMEF